MFILDIDQQDDGLSRQTTPPAPAPQAQGSAPVATATTGSQLRSRFHPAATSTGASESSRDGSGQTGSSVRDEPEQVPDQQSEGEGGDESLITVRLILYGSTTKPIQVSPTSTLADVRRYTV